MLRDRQIDYRKFFSWLTVIGRPFFWLSYVLLLVFGFVAELVFTTTQQFHLYFRVAQKFIEKLAVRLSYRPHKKLKPISGWKIAQYITVITFVFIGISSGLFYWFVVRDLPSPQRLIDRSQAVTTKIYDRNGELLYKVYKNQNRTIVPLNEIPPFVVNATIAIEDAEFFDHPGFSVKGIMRALTTNLRSDSMQGGSTITQQLIKNTLLTNEKTLVRKLKEVVLALQVEYYFTKDEILSMYFNEVPYGGTAYGIEEAAQLYFGKSVRDVSVAEAALLAGLPQAPTVYSPFGADPQLAISRQHAVIRRMVEEHMLDEAQAKAALMQPLVFAQPKIDIKAPHFVMYVKDQLVKRYGEATVTSGGLEVKTTLDLQIQAIAEAAIQKELARLANLKVTNGAALVINPQNGEILAMVGSKNYFDTAHDGQVNVTLRPRQPGSSIKPLTYALALSERLMTPATLIDDSPVVYHAAGSPAYAPQNYDGRFHGRVTVRQSLANSYNIPAVKTLAQLGVQHFVGFARDMGITTWEDSSRFGLSLTLGGGEIKMIDMAQVYSVFATGGRKIPLTPFIEVDDFADKNHDSFQCDKTQKGCLGEQVLDPGVAFLISDILADNDARSAAFGARSVLVVPNQQVAVKTGTTNDMRDNWTFGYTSDYLVATWVGNNDNTPMSQVASGITGASPIWQSIMMALYENQPSHQFVAPADVVYSQLCSQQPDYGCAICKSGKQEYYLTGTEPRQICTPEPSPDPSMPTEQIRDRILDGARDVREKKDRDNRPRFR